MISISFDVDWTPDCLLLGCLDLLSTTENVKATFFAIHEIPVLFGDHISRHEFGFHPNFILNFYGKGRNYHKVI